MIILICGCLVPSSTVESFHLAIFFLQPACCRMSNPLSSFKPITIKWKQTIRKPWDFNSLMLMWQGDNKPLTSMTNVLHPDLVDCILIKAQSWTHLLLKAKFDVLREEIKSLDQCLTLCWENVSHRSGACLSYWYPLHSSDKGYKAYSLSPA